MIVLCFFGRLRIVFDEPGDYGGPSTMCCDGERRNSCNLNERSEFFVASLFRRGVVDLVVEHLFTAGLLPYFLDDAIHDGEDFSEHGFAALGRGRRLGGCCHIVLDVLCVA